MHTSRRHFLSAAITSGFATSLALRARSAPLVNDEIGIGFISCGNRAGKLMTQFDQVPGVRVNAVCDVDQERLGTAMQRYPRANSYQDMRELLADKSVDAVVISTCNHWHCLAAIWAMEAGKDVYVEKPLSHTQWEGRQVVAAARRYNRICQVGTQQRSDPMQAEIKRFLHEDKGLGEVLAVRVNHYFIRESIGKRDTPLPIQKSLDFDLWSGPAQTAAVFRDSLHYDWHWDWNTGSGEMGNWGVHILDDVRNNVFRDSIALPSRILAGGGRVAFNDAGQTPNVHFAYFDTGSIPVVINLTNLPDKPGSKKRPDHLGPHSGYVVECEGGRLEGQRKRAVAKTSDGSVIKAFSGNSGDVLHQQNFIDAVRARNHSILNADVVTGNASTGWCNLANVAFRVGFQEPNSKRFSADGIHDAVNVPEWHRVVSAMDRHLQAHELRLNSPDIRLSPLLEIDPTSERFVGENAEAGNPLLIREYRQGFEVPKLDVLS